MKKHAMFIFNRDTAAIIAEELNQKGIATSLSYLPVTRNSACSTAKEVKEYHALIQLIDNKKLNSDVTVKVHQIGFFHSPQRAENNMRLILDQAKQKNIRVWLDMERPNTVTNTIQIFKNIAPDFDNLGLCVQAYLKRTEADIKDILPFHRAIRLVKGFYRSADFNTWQEVTANYKKLMHILINEAQQPCLATHDPHLLEEAIKLAEPRKKDLEFQRFLGVRENEMKPFTDQGFKLRVYIPYGNIFAFLANGLHTFDNGRHLQRIFRQYPIQ